MNKTYIMSVDHRDNTGKFFYDSYIKDYPLILKDNETIHQGIARVLTEKDGCTMSYKGKPQGNVYRDTKDGGARIVGYLYRTKHYISDRSANVSRDNVPIETWVTIHGEIVPVELEDVEK